MSGMMLTPAILAGPAAPPPPGVMPNLVNPQSRAPGATAAIVVVLAIMLIVLTMRLISKSRYSRSLGTDDWMALTAGIVATCMSAVTIAAFNEGGLGPHWWNVPLEDFINPAFTARLFTLQVVNGWAVMFAKLSILFFLLRLFPPTARKALSIFIYLGIILNVIYTVILTLYLIIECAPRSGTNGQFPAQCDGNVRDEVGWASAALGIFLDLYVLAISIPTIANLQMSFKRKIGVILVLATGLLACICSILVLYYRVTISSTVDPSWNQIPQIILGMYEPLIAIITACLPALPVLWAHLSNKGSLSFRRLMSRFSGFTSSRSNRSREYQSHRNGTGDDASNGNSSRKASDVELASYQEQKLSDLQPTVVGRN